MTAHTTTTPGSNGGRGEPIAVVGSGMRFPGSANSPSKLWDLLIKPRDLLQRIPESRFNVDNFYHPDPTHHATTDVRESYFLDQDHRHFDAGFFNIKPVEVAAIDPQQRLLMEVVYEALEAAGIPLESLAGSRTGVYVGLMCTDYVDHLYKDVDTLPTYAPTGTARSIMSNRISYFFDWHGPSMTIDTACSSSLVAVHQAVQLLRSGDSDVAVAAGSNMILSPGQYIAESTLHMLSADSRSRMWDADASGYARGEGVAAVIMKRLSTALADGDRIECIIRETGVNQDGRSKGITMPNAAAQIDLIEQTYAKAGLDPRDPSQRCQYFEAHGTGTAAGDPKEAEAISKAFFYPGERISDADDPLYVGSIKTVIGHTEGTAGLAGLLKASLAVQYGVVPPNMLFNKLHPDIEPFYTNLEIATAPKPWPKLADGVPRRASVNSFGFGGTNSHVIVENFVPPTPPLQGTKPLLSSRPFTPFNFSAASAGALRGVLSDYSEYLRSHPDVNLRDLAYTLYARRTHHALRASIPAKSASELLSKIDELLHVPSDASGGSSGLGTRAKTLSRPIRILGVFTGQGAQWPTMGRELVRSSPYVREIVEDLDRELQRLPEPERPHWTLLDQLTCDASSSRVGEAAYAQPLTTAVEIVLYDLLRRAGIRFQAVVGHSSGEIAAAYAQGFITRAEAIKIAYYRGYYATVCPSETPGAMMAAGTTAEDAEELCALPMFQGRLCVAAYNAPMSVTLSGDRDAVEQAREILEDEKKFARVLKVDKAYHSPHMQKVAPGFLDALRRCGIRPRQRETTGDDAAAWLSSTYEDTEMRGDMDGDRDLAGPYWVNNLLRPVRFTQAVQAAAASAQGPFDFAMEVGPHAALKGPVLETLREITNGDGEAVPYVGLLHRGKDDVDAFCEALGTLWTRFSPSPVDFGTVDSTASGDEHGRNLLKDLPTYHWDHDRLYWHESRTTRALTNSRNPPHPLLGTRTTEATERELRWRNLLKLSEMPWVRGHQLQGQVVYPATAYLATAVEAARCLAPAGQNIALIEVQDFSLGKPLVFGDDDRGIETLFVLHDVAREGDNSHVAASFSYHASTNAEVDNLSTHATGRVRITLGETDARRLPSRKGDPPNLSRVTQDQFYSSLEPLGYSYSGDFRTLSSIERKLDYSSATIPVPPQDPASEPARMLLHPALLDTALQGIFLAYCFPGDGSFEQLHVPTGIRNVCVNVGLCEQTLLASSSVTTCAHLTENPLRSRRLRGDVDIYTAPDGAGLVQMEGIEVVALAEPTAEADKKMFTEHRWGVLNPNLDLAMRGHRATDEDREFAEVMERVCLHYMQRILAMFPESVRETMNLEWHFRCLFEFYHHAIATAGTRRFSKREWLDDTPEEIAALKAKWSHRVELQLACAVGDNLPAVLRGETTILEHMTKDRLLDRFYEAGMGLREFTLFLGRTVKQMVHRHPRMKMLEIGAGTGGATKVIMSEIGRAFGSYTFTDISTSFFEVAQEVFYALGDKMIFKPLDCEKDVAAQGFEEHSYDLVIASLVLHATADLRRTLRNVRRLLKPGGYLIMQEITNNDVTRVGFMMSATPGWWLGQDDGRRLSPCVSTLEWHQLFLECGFSGVDTSTSEIDIYPFSLTDMVTTAVDDRVSLLREPLSSLGTQAAAAVEWDLVLIGGQKLGTSRLIDQIVRLVQPFGVKHTVFGTLGDMAATKTSPNSAILCLAELDDPVFRDISEPTLQGMQRLFETQGTILWVTQGSRADEPYMNMSVGLIRVVLLENPDLTVQVLDLDSGAKPDARRLLESLLRLRYATTWEKDGIMDKMLWTQEHELALDGDELLVSRVYHDNGPNDRYNAFKRTIYEDVDPQTTPLSLSIGSGPPKPHLVHEPSLRDRMSNPQAAADDSHVLIKVSHSLLTPGLAPPLQPAYLLLGTTASTAPAKTIVSIAPNNGSYALVPQESAVEVDVAPGNESQFLSQLAHLLRVENLLSICRRDSTLLIHQPPQEMASSIVAAAASRNVAVFFTTSSAPATDDGPWIAIDSYAQRREIQSLLPPDVTVFIDGSNSKDAPAKRLGAVISSSLPDPCLRTTLAGIHELQHARDFTAADLRSRLNSAVHSALKNSALSDGSGLTLPTITLNQLLAGEQPEVDAGEPAVLDWGSGSSSPAKVPVQVPTVESLVRFRSDKTYVMFGLTSDLAQSICSWMASLGARNIVLTSRNPKVDERWLKVMRDAGVRLEVFANDITDEAALSSLVAHIRQTFPPIAGIAHGAMVLDDTVFSVMPLEKMTKVLRPKVLGAIHLDALFGPDTGLDFFVFFSSAVTIAGNRGQSAYSAANSFMTALAHQRRRRGLAASILHIGAVMGVGYVNRNWMAALHETARVGFQLLSEREFHLCFGEAVLASHPRSGRNPELMTALRTSGLAGVKTRWPKFPRFQTCLQADDGSAGRKATKRAADVSVKTRLAEATTEEEVYDIVQDGFIRKLRAILQIPADKEASQILASAIDDLGVDSLVAVEIRSWFLKELDAEVPVFKILSGGLVRELLEHAVANMPASKAQPGEPSAKAAAAGLDSALPATPDAAALTGTPQTVSADSSSSSHSDDEQDKQETSSATSTSVEEDSSEVPKPRFDKILPISPGQSRFWFQKLLMEDQTTANSTICVEISGAIRLGSLESAVRQVAARHESLRTSFFVDETTQKPVQAISPTSNLGLETMLLADESRVQNEFERLKNHVYDIEHGECMRIIHLGLTPTKSYLLIGAHHIIMDGIGLEVLLDDLQKAYNGRDIVAEPVYQYSTYSEKLREDLASGALRGEMEYWRAEFAEPPSPLPLLPFSAATSRTPLTAYGHKSASRAIGSQLGAQIQDACHKLRANAFHFHLGVLQVLLFKTFGDGDVCIGMADANRRDDRVAKSIGMYLNLLPLRFRLDSRQSFEEVLRDTRKKAYLAMANSKLPFDILLDCVSCERSTAFSPLFQAFINYRQGVSEKRRFDSAQVEIKAMELPRSAYDISLDIIENPGGETRVTFMVQESLYSESDAARLLDMYFALLSDLSRSCQQELQQVSLFSKQDVSDAIQFGRGPVMPSKWPETLAHRVDDIIAKYPGETSIKDCNGKSWTYQQLDSQVERISSALLMANTKPGSVVGVHQEASPHFVFSLLAILRVGAVAVPLDCNIPPARLRIMIQESKCSALLVNTTTAALTGDLGLSPTVTVLDVLQLPDDETPVRRPATAAARAGDPAAILFTSGTTGVPKGVLLSHGSLRNHVEALVHTHGFGRETVLQQSSVGFDMSLNQIFMALANGGTLVIVPEALRKDPVAVARIVREENITYTSATPSEYLAWLRHGAASLFQSTHWTYATAGGERFSPALLQGFRQIRDRFVGRKFRFFNAYGPTECSMSASELDLSRTHDHEGAQIPAGRTLPNYSVYIMDQNLNVLPVGWSGEVCIAGAGVAIDYINNADESRKKFLEDPLPSSVAVQNGWTRMYRTGDKGVLRPDGTLEILGRIEGDTQIKLRGLRIELQDVEQSILDTAKGRIKTAVVTPRGDPPILVAHAVLSPDAAAENENETDGFLRQLAASLPLPQYMRPAAIIPIPSMPLTASGKVDRRALQQLALPSVSRGGPEPTRELTEMEAELARAWRDTLPQQMQEVHRIDAASDFFHVGGNSMLLIELRQLVNERFQTSVPLIKLFENSTLAAMAAAIQDISSSSDADAAIDWDAETAVPEDLLPGVRTEPEEEQRPPRDHKSPKTVVITGATGLLGSALVRLLAESAEVGTIHCIAVRDTSKLAELARSSSPKVVLHKGDLTQARCGLSEAEAAALAGAADAVIHNGADVSFLKTYASLRAANLLSTKELVRLFASRRRCRRRIPLHFVSTATVGKFSGSDTLAPASVAAFPPDLQQQQHQQQGGGAGLANGYAASKWASDVFLERAAQQLRGGLRVFIHRPSAIMGAEAGDDVLSSLLEYGSILQALPDASRWTGFVDLVSLEHAAAGIVRSVLRSTTTSSSVDADDAAGDDDARVEYLHHAGDQVIPVQRIRDLLNGGEGGGGVGLQSLPMGEWVDRAVRSGMNPLVGEFLRQADGGRGLQIGQKLLLRKED